MIVNEIACNKIVFDESGVHLYLSTGVYKLSGIRVPAGVFIKCVDPLQLEVKNCDFIAVGEKYD